MHKLLTYKAAVVREMAVVLLPAVDVRVLSEPNVLQNASLLLAFSQERFQNTKRLVSTFCEKTFVRIRKISETIPTG